MQQALLNASCGLANQPIEKVRTNFIYKYNFSWPLNLNNKLTDRPVHSEYQLVGWGYQGVDTTQQLCPAPLWGLMSLQIIRPTEARHTYSGDRNQCPDEAEQRHIKSEAAVGSRVAAAGHVTAESPHISAFL